MDCGRDSKKDAAGRATDLQNSSLQLLSPLLRLPATALHGYRHSLRMAALVAFPYIFNFFSIHTRFKT